MSPPLILIADAQQETRHQVRQSLEENGFRALPAASASDIWNAMDSMPVGAVVLDAALRGPDGMDLCRDVRERSDVPIILVGANSSEVDRVVGLELGADDYMAKPYSTRELAEGWVVNSSRREVIDPDGGTVELTAAEFSLLLVLLDHPQVVIARSRLMELAGVRDTPSSDRSIDVLVSRLRRKLGHGGRSAPIVTVRGGGYMFSAVVDRR
jgi:DNA-binding response OmpR family regulator